MKSAWVYDDRLSKFWSGWTDTFMGRKFLCLKEYFHFLPVGALVPSPSSSSPSCFLFFLFCFENILKIDYVIIRFASTWQQNGLRNAWKVSITKPLLWLWTYLVSRLIHSLQHGYTSRYKWKSRWRWSGARGSCKAHLSLPDDLLSSLFPSLPLTLVRDCLCCFPTTLHMARSLHSQLFNFFPLPGQLWIIVKHSLMQRPKINISIVVIF